MITKEALKKAGYREFKSNKGDGLLQKWLHNDSGTRLFALNFYVWNIPKTTVEGVPFGNEDLQHFSAEARLYQAGNLSFDTDTSFDLDLILGAGATVEKVEDFFRESFLKLGCIPDPHN